MSRPPLCPATLRWAVNEMEIDIAPRREALPRLDLEWPANKAEAIRTRTEVAVMEHYAARWAALATRIEGKEEAKP